MMDEEIERLEREYKIKTFEHELKKLDALDTQLKIFGGLLVFWVIVGILYVGALIWEVMGLF